MTHQPMQQNAIFNTSPQRVPLAALLPALALVLCLLALLTGCGGDDEGKKPTAKKPSFSQVLEDPAIPGMMMAFKNGLPADGDAALQEFTDRSLITPADEEGGRQASFLWKAIKAIFWITVIWITLPWVLGIVGITAAWSADSIPSAIALAVSAMGAACLWAIVLVVFQFVTTDDDMDSQTLNRYKRMKPALPGFYGDVRVSMDEPVASFTTREKTDSNANTLNVVRELVLDVKIHNDLPMPLLAGEARCQVQVGGKKDELKFAIFPKMDTLNIGVSHISDYWLQPANSTINFHGEISVAKHYPKLDVGQARILGCAVTHLLADKYLLQQGKNSEVEIKTGPGYVELTNHTDRAIKHVVLYCVPRLDLWPRVDPQDRLAISVEFKASQYPQGGGDGLYNLEARPLRINTTERYGLQEKRPQLCSVGNYVSY